MKDPTDVIREAVRVELARRKMSQSELAEQLGTSRQHLSKAMTGGTSELPLLWRETLEILGLELYVGPKGSSHSPSDPKADYEALR